MTTGEFTESESVDGLEPLERWERPDAMSGVVQHYSNEVLGLCPFYEGVRDHYDVYIKYQPGEYCVELKSLKFYFQQFEDMRISHEEICGTFYEDLKELLNPEWIEVQTIVGRRGSVDTSVVHSNRPQDEASIETDVLSQTVSRE